MCRLPALHNACKHAHAHAHAHPLAHAHPHAHPHAKINTTHTRKHTHNAHAKIIIIKYDYAQALAGVQSAAHAVHVDLCTLLEDLFF